MRRVVAVLLGLSLIVGGCGGDDDEASPTTISSTTTSTTTEPSSTTTEPTTTSTATSTTSTTTTSTTTTTTIVPEPVCDPADVADALDAVLVDARLAPGGAWEPAPADAPFVADTADPDNWAVALGLDCGAQLVQPDAPGDRLALVSWTGPRMAFAIRATDAPDPLPVPTSLITVGFEDPRGEYVRDDFSVWVGVLESGDTLVVGHIDFNLGVAAKTFTIDAPPFGTGDITLPAEQVAIDLLTAVDARNVGIAQPPEFGSEEGYVQFVSPTGQILVVDVAPDGWFDPMRPRYFTGETEVLDIEGVAVRVTRPADGEGEFTVGAEVAWACADHVWILEPSSNGTGEEMVAFVETLLAASDC